MKHNIMPKKVPVQEIKVEIEKCVNSAVMQVARDEMQEAPPVVTVKDKKTAFNECLNNITHSKCNLEFRDNIKFALKTFIGKAKAICNTRPIQAFHKTLKCTC